MLLKFIKLNLQQRIFIPFGNQTKKKSFIYTIFVRGQWVKENMRNKMLYH